MRRIIFALSVCAIASSTLLLAKEDAFKNKDNANMTMTYPVSDLPVWTKDGKFSPNLLIELLPASVNDAAFDSTKIVPFPSNTSVVIDADRSTHAKIQSLIEKLRSPKK